MATNYKPTKTEQLKAELMALYMKYWQNIATNIFEWGGFPENISSDLLSSEIMEKWLFEEGKAVFFKDSSLGFLCLKVNKEGFNVVGKPTAYRAWGNGYEKRLSPDECVFIKNNETELATKDPLQYYCECIADIELTKKLRRNAHKTPFMLETTPETELTAKNIFKQIDADEPALYRNKGRGEETTGVNVLNTGVDYINDRLNDEKNSYIADILTLLGLDNYVEDKAERVQSAEVEANQEYINQAFRASLEKRQKACEEINKKFGLNLYVKYAQGEEIEAKQQDKTEENKDEEGNPNE